MHRLAGTKFLISLWRSWSSIWNLSAPFHDPIPLLFHQPCLLLSFLLKDCPTHDSLIHLQRRWGGPYLRFGLRDEGLGLRAGHAVHVSGAATGCHLAWCLECSFGWVLSQVLGLLILGNAAALLLKDRQLWSSACERWLRERLLASKELARWVVRRVVVELTCLVGVKGCNAWIVYLRQVVLAKS